MNNTLGIIDMKIVKTQEFFNEFKGYDIAVWETRGGLFYLKEFNEITFVEAGTIFRGKGVMLLGKRDLTAFTVECENGFGFDKVGGDKSYWVDKINEKEAAVIIYKNNEEAQFK